MTVYLERGVPVRLLTKHRLPSRANPPAPQPAWLHWHLPPRGAPRNALIQRADGTTVVRSFRGLRRPA